MSLSPSVPPSVRVPVSFASTRLLHALTIFLLALASVPASTRPAAAAEALVPGTALGGAASDGATAIALLSGGDAIVAGNTASASFPATLGAAAGGQDVWVGRFDGRFRERRWLRRLGGSATDGAVAVATDAAGNVYLAGTTASADFPAAAAYDATANGGTDAFLVKLDGATGAVLFSSYLGGSGDDEALGLAIDAGGRALVAGGSASADFPLADPLGPNAGGRDGFLTRFAASGANLDFSTRYGAPMPDAFTAIDLDNSGNVYLALVGEAIEGFAASRLLKLSGSTFAVLYDFEYGPQPASDGAIAVDALVVDGLGRAIFAGVTNSSELPRTSAWQADPVGGAELFLARLDAAGASLDFSTYLGGEDDESGAALALGSDGSIFVAGASRSLDFPLRRPLDDMPAQLDGVLARFSEDGQELLAGTFFGGSGDDRLAGVAAGADGVATVAGAGDSPDLPITGLLPPGGGPDGFAARLKPVGVARFLPWRTVTLAEPDLIPAPFTGAADLDGDGVADGVAIAANLPLVASSVVTRGAGGRDLVSLTLGTLGGATIAGLADVDRDGENELLVDDPGRDRGVFEGWLLDNGDQDVDLVVRGTGGSAGLLLADLDGDLESELVARDPLSPVGAFEAFDNGEPMPDGRPDVVFVGGTPRAFLDLDDDGENELVAELPSGPSGTIEIRDGVDGGDGDADIYFVRGTYFFAADLDADLIPELFFERSGAAPGSVERVGQVLFLGGQPRMVADLDGDRDLELVAQSAGLAPGFASIQDGVVFLGGAYLGLADVDGDGEPEILATSAAQGPGTYSVGIGLESPPDLDPDIVFLPPGARGVADLDDDGELEIVAENGSLPPGSFAGAASLEAVPDGDDDVVFVNGRLDLFADLDGDGETELVVHSDSAAAGSAAGADGLGSGADGDVDVVFIAGTGRVVADLDGDGEAEAAAEDAVGGVIVHRTLDAPGDGDADLVLTPGTIAGTADLDADGERELLAGDPALAPAAVALFTTLESPGDGDADVVRVGGVPRLVGDLDGDGENELVAEVAAASPGSVSVYGALESPADGDGDVVFVRSGAAALADLDGDGENELLAGDGSAAAGTAVVGAELDGGDGDPDVIFLGGTLRGLADLDGDGETEALAEAAIPAATATVATVEGDGDPDLVFTGGRARAIGDFDGDGEDEAALEHSELAVGTVTVVTGLEGDGDADLVFTGGTVQGVADYDNDGEAELVTTDARIAGGSSFHQRDLDGAADEDPDVAFLGTGVVDGVRDPNGGEIWRIGSTQAIHWSLPASPGNVRVQLSRDGGATWSNLIGSTPNDGEQLWDVKGAPTSRALVRVQSQANPAVSDTSDHVFTIPPAAILLQAPNANQTFQVGSHIEIAWSSSNLAGGIEVALSRDGGATWEIIDPTTPNDGSKTWTVTGPATTQAVFRVRSAVENSVADVGDGSNTILATSLQVTSPNGGETLLLGSTATLTWSTSGLAGALNVDLSRDGGASWERILTNTANDGNQAWNVVGAPTSRARIRLTSISNPGISDASDADFTIPPATLAVISPNGGETLPLGNLVNLQWSSADVGGASVKIDLSRDGGATWETLFATTPNDGVQQWRVVGAPTTQALLRVAAKNEPAVFDVSDATFTIPPASLTLTSPNGGESWTFGSSRTITWSSSNLGGAVDLELSRDGGATWDLIVGNTANDGTQAWVVTGPPTGQALVRVKSVFVPLEDASNAVFTIP